MEHPIRRCRNLSLCLLLYFVCGACFAAGLKEGLADFDRGNYPSALATLRPLADKGDVSAQYTLGIASYQGMGMAQDYGLAMKWFSLAAAQGLAPAEYCVGVMYAHGQGVREDPRAALDWYRRAAVQGYPAALHNLAIQYGQGRGVAQDMAVSLAYFMLSAERGIADDAAKRDMLLLNLDPNRVAGAKRYAATLRAAIRPAKLPPLPQLGDSGNATPAK